MSAPAGAPRALDVIRLAAGRELRQRLRAKSYYLFTGLLVVVIVGIGVLSRVVGGPGDGAEVTRAAVAGDAATLGPLLVEAGARFDRPVEVVAVADGDEARAALGDGRADVAVVADDQVVLFQTSVDDEVLGIAQQAWAASGLRSSLSGAGLSDAQIDQALSPPALRAGVVDGQGQGDQADGVAVLAGTLAGILLFISLQTFGGYVLMGVVEEKSTAVVEVLLVRAPADQLLAGKVVGIGLAGLGQLAAAVVAGLAALAIADVEVPSQVWSTLPMALVWFLGGYALYSTLFALAGSLVSRQEDAQAASAPILTVLIGAYALIFFFGYVPDSVASTVLSLLPPIAPLLMPMRMAAGAATPVEVVAALVLLVVATLGVWKLSGRVYEQVILRRGSRIPWRDALSLARRR